MFVPLAPVAKKIGVGLRRRKRAAACLGRWRALSCACGTKPRRGPPGYRTGPPACAQSREMIRWTRLNNFFHCFFPDWLSCSREKARTTSHHHQISELYVQPNRKSAESPCSVAAFVVNSEPHTGARPLVRLCVGLINTASQLRLRPHTYPNQRKPHTYSNRRKGPGVGL
jgi:hypothetical protein